MWPGKQATIRPTGHFIATSSCWGQPPSGERQSSGEPSSLTESDDKSSQITVSDSSLVIFEKRILPIFQSAKPSSCAECHLSGVDLKEYIRPTQQQTFASLVSA